MPGTLLLRGHRGPGLRSDVAGGIVLAALLLPHGMAYVELAGVWAVTGLSLVAFVRRAWRPHDAVLGRVDGLKGDHDTAGYPAARLVPGLVPYRFDAPPPRRGGRRLPGGRRDGRAARDPSPVRLVLLDGGASTPCRRCCASRRC